VITQLQLINIIIITGMIIGIKDRNSLKNPKEFRAWKK